MCPPVWDGFELPVKGERVLGCTLAAGGPRDARQPAAILLHGFPGHTQNTDLAAALMRCGITAVCPHYRGSWGSDGCYRFTGNIEDAVAVAEALRSPAFAERYRIDTGSIFLVGHSIGGFTALHAMSRLPWIRGTVCLAPYDPASFFQRGETAPLRELLAESGHVHARSPEALLEDVQAHWRELLFPALADRLRGRSLCLIGAKRDTVAPPEQMIEPLLRELTATGGADALRYELLDTDHSFTDCRIALADRIVRWIVAQEREAPGKEDKS